VVTSINSAGFRTLTPAYLKPAVNKPSVSARDAYISDLHATALYWFELHEEGHRGHSRLPSSVAPECFNGTALRNYLFDELYSRQSCSITEAALALSEWALDGTTLPFDALDIRSDLIIHCAPDERLRCPVTDTGEEASRAFRRYARELVRLATENRARSAHTRLIDWFVRADLIPRGQSREYQQSAGADRHQEHTVPLAYLRDKAIDLVRAGWHVEDLAKLISHYTAIVDITDKQRQRLDHGVTLGGLGLKTGMPDGWTLGEGCAFDRLHAAGIYFDFPKQSANCPACASS